MGDTLAADLAAGNAANSANAKVIAPLKTSKVPFKELFSAIRAVSYTHLDVYKRQAL